ncbi:MAG: hypothetical protein WD770_07285 [Actinomycetota bacterium]
MSEPKVWDVDFEGRTYQIEALAAWEGRRKTQLHVFVTTDDALPPRILGLKGEDWSVNRDGPVS